MRLSQRLSAIKPSPTLSLNAKAKALAAQGADVVSFAAGEPDFDTPQFIKQAAVAALDQGFTKYTPTAGMPELREAICQKLAAENGLAYKPDQVLVSCGAKHSLFNIFQTLLDPGDEVVIVSPYWVSYPDMVRLAGGTPVFVAGQPELGYAPRAADLTGALTPRTRAVVLNSPSNPTGGVMSEVALRDIARALEGAGAWVVTDDIYERLRYVPGPFKNILNVAPNLAPRALVVNGFSKAFAMTGWRLGYTAGPKEVIAGMQNLQDQSTSNATSIAQKAGVAALQGPRDEMEAMVVEFKARRDLILERLLAIPGVTCVRPDGAFYAFPSFQAFLGRSFRGRRIDSSVQLSELLLEEFLIAAVPGAPFGAEGHLRFSFATSRALIEKGMDRLARFAQSV